jgi:septal ring factor EnvC (AmiA/AmiB activator)
MSEENPTGKLSDQSFEQRVFARFDAIDEDFRKVFVVLEEHGERLTKLESKSYDTKPIWERALQEILETRRQLSETKDQVDGLGKEVAEVKNEVAGLKNEFTEGKREQKEFRREVTKRLDQIQLVQLENRVRIRDVEDQIERIESQLT